MEGKIKTLESKLTIKDLQIDNLSTKIEDLELTEKQIKDESDRTIKNLKNLLQEKEEFDKLTENNLKFEIDNINESKLKLENDFNKKLIEKDNILKLKDEKEFELSNKILDHEQENIASKNMISILKEKIENINKLKSEKDDEMQREIKNLKNTIVNKENLAND